MLNLRIHSEFFEMDIIEIGKIDEEKKTHIHLIEFFRLVTVD